MIPRASHSTVAANSFYSGRVLIDPGLLAMSTEAERLRFAIAVFYDLDRLLSALNAFLELGLITDDICLAGKKHLLKDGSELHGALAAQNTDTKRLLKKIRSVGKLPSETLLYATNGMVLPSFQGPGTQQDMNCFEKLLKGRIGAILQDHADKNAIIAMVKTSTPELQDQCVRVLLRFSLDKVYSQECR